MDKSKSEFIQIRVKKDEKEQIKKKAKDSGFDTITAFVLWLIRKHKS